MFSHLTRSDFSVLKASSYSNALDIAKKALVNVAWIDNNSDSKGVAKRLKNVKNIRNSCNGECLDEKMLEVLPKYIKQGENNIIVLHQMGNHGPAYYKRYPKEFEKFKPICKTNQLQECKKEEIVNTYDNIILYSDYFLSKTINLLKKYSTNFQTALVYVSDHGESLGENGIYLHAMPYLIAPQAQKRVGAFVWFDKNFNINKKCANEISTLTYSHDNYFSTILGLMDIETKVYNKELDIFNKCKK
jgi:lipid A ethanolaminephosphotransferase